MVKSIIGDTKRCRKDKDTRSLSYGPLPWTSILLFVLTYLYCFQPVTAGSLGGDETPDGQPVQIVFPPELRLKNKGGSDGAGLCVFTSLSHAARWQNVPPLVDFRDWMTKYPGGGYPSKVDAMIKKLCGERGVPVPAYIQIEGNDLTVLERACKAGRMPSITYSVSATGRYNGGQISHMVSLVHADLTGAGQWAILDNNYIDKLEWLTTEEFKRTFIGKPFQGSPAKGWAVFFLNPGSVPTLRTL